MADGKIKKPDIPIVIGDGSFDASAPTLDDAAFSARKFGGIPYGLDYGLSFSSPSRVSINFVSEDGLYDTDDLDKIVFEEGVRGIPHAIQFLGDKKFSPKLFYGFPLKYSIKNSPSGNLLTVDYFDTSIIWLDNRFVLLAGEDIPFSASSQEALNKKKGAVDQNIIANPCPEHFLIMGREYTQLATPLIHGRRLSCEDQQQNSVTLYSNHELAQKLLDVKIPVDEKSLAVLSPKKKDGAKDESKTVLEAFHGTLRQVLNSWASRMGFTYYWDTDESEFEIAAKGTQPEDLKTGKLKFIDLTKPLTYEKIKRTVDLAVKSCNLLEKTVTHSMEDTFSQAISAKYTKAGGYPYGQPERFAFLDLLSLPVHGCYTCKGKEWPPKEYTGDEDKRQNDTTWYQEWDAANYYAKQDDSDIRRWAPIEFQRPQSSDCDCADGVTEKRQMKAAAKAKEDKKTEVFRDWIRLIKAAAIGQEFFKSYVFLKKLGSNPNMITPTLADLQTLSTLQGGGGADDRNVGITEIAAKLMQAGKIIVSKTSPKGGAAKTYEVGSETFYQLRDAGTAKPGDLLGDAAGYSGNVSGLVPVVPNKALDVLITSGDNDRATEPYPNVKICNGVVVGKDCLTVNLLHPVWNDVQQLYLDTSNTAPCGKKKSRFKNSIEVDSIEEDGRVARIVAFRNPDQGATSFVISAKTNADTDSDIRKNGSPYIFHKVNSYGNSFILDSAEYDGLYLQLRSLAENAGRFYVSPELATRKEFNKRDYTNSSGSVRFEEKIIDVGDTDFDGLFESFDPMAAIAKKSMPNEIYHEFCFCCGVNEDECDCPDSDLFGNGSACELINKNRPSKERGLGQRLPPSLPADFPLDLCSEDGDHFGYGNEKGQPKNTARPNLEQWIACLSRKAMLCADWQPKGGNLIKAQTFEASTVLVTPAAGGNPAEYRLEYIYKAGMDEDFTGGRGYTNSSNEGGGPALSFKVLNGGSIDVQPVYALVIEQGTITEIIFELPGVIKAGDNGEDPMVEIEFPDPPSEERNFFGSVKNDVGMDEMDSILKQNYDKRNKDKDELCCCTNLDEGVVYYDTGSKLKTWLPEDVLKQVKRISEGVNLPIQNTDMNTLVDVLSRENQTITFSTNLIPINRLRAAGGKDGVAPHADDELDWIVDQITIGDPFDNHETMEINPLDDGASDQRLKCKYIKEILYKKEGDSFEMVGFAMPKKIDQESADAVGGQGNESAGNDNQTAGEAYEVLVNKEIGEGHDPCELFKYNVKEYRVNFMNVGDEDIEGLEDADCEGDIPVEGSLEWDDFVEKRMKVIKDGIASFLKKQSYLQDNRLFSTSLTIADNGLLDEKGNPVKFDNGKEGVPGIEEGLESLNISVSSSGSQIIIGIGTKKKLRVLDPNFDQWEKLAPRIKRILGMATGQGNG